MSSGRDGADERFAAAWDERARRGASGRRAQPGASGAPFGDHDSPGDPDLEAELRIAEMLGRTGRATPGPDPETSRRMRAGLMAAIAEESTQVPVTRRSERVESSGAGHGRRRAERRGGSRPGDDRPGAAVAAVGPGRATRRSATLHKLLSTTAAGMACVLALGALTVLLSRGALPGDMLYGLKRASESTEIGLTSGQESKARKHLDVAALRLDEISELVQRDTSTAAGPRPTAAGADDADAALVQNNLQAFEDQARTGAKMLLPLVNRPTGPPPTLLSDWAGAQQRTLDGFAASLPSGGKQQAASSQRLISQLRDRASAFGKSTTSCANGSSTDDLGPLPSPSCGSGSRGTPDSTSKASTSASSAASSSSESSPSTSAPSAASSSTEPPARRSSTTTGTTASTSQSTSRTDDSDHSPLSTSTTKPPIQVPVPVPGLPKVQLPPLLPGLPGLSLG